MEALLGAEVAARPTAHPGAAWTLQQLREAVGFEDQYAYLLHDRDCIFSQHLDESIERLGVKVLRSPPRSAKAKAICERVIGTVRRECLDWLIPLSEHHLRHILRSWIRHYTYLPIPSDIPSLAGFPQLSNGHNARL
jgi:putative transposase